VSGHGQDGLQVASWSYNSRDNSEKNVEDLPAKPRQQHEMKTLANMKRSTFWLILGLVSLSVIGISVSGVVDDTIRVCREQQQQ